ncbi:Tfp pilus assembly protein PilF [Nitrospina gracilis]|uniref:tetratricopeptide repeat protein n=1 Tax=Nitrospina sp. Nb-3 TaxID=2940485 RepID=UPI001F443DE4|nr:tetratricopeptide repeat protein [Nitrospina sp. Nb-3]MCF8722523.1 Tfp pilus assembly protein PilF [Nitrospina sp. Nb-3]
MIRLKFPDSSKSALPLVFLALFFFVLIVFWAALDNGFVDWDDNGYILGNTMIRSLAPENILHMLISLQPFYWQPMTWLSHAIDYRLFGLEPAGHHFVSIVLHGINAFLVFLLIFHFANRAYPGLRGRSGVLLACAWAALVFAVHPLRVESVVWAAERKDLLCALFMFSALLVYLWYADATEKAERQRWYKWVLFLFLLALMSKPMAVTFPVVVLILDLYPLNRISSRTDAWKCFTEKIPHFVMSFATAVITFIAQKIQGAVVAIDELSFTVRIVNALRSTVFYIEKTLWPQPLVPLYPFPDWDVRMWLEVATFFVICWFCIVKWNEGRRYWMAVWLIYLVTLSPVIGIIQVGGQAAADRFTYIPTLGFYVLLALGVIRLWRFFAERRREVLASVIIGYFAIVVIGVTSVWTIKQIPVWKNTGVFWEWVIAHFPDKLARAHTNLGIYYNKQGNEDGAMDMFRQAIRIKEDYEPPYNLLALAYQNRGQWEQAEKMFHDALAVKQDAMVENNLGLLYMQKGDHERAETWFRKAVATNPDFAQPYNNLGLLFEKMKQPEEAERFYKKAIETNFDLSEAHANLGNLYKKRKQFDAAIVEFSISVFLSPDNADMHNAFAEALMAAGYLDKAEQQLKKALHLRPGHVSAQANLRKIHEHKGSAT